MEEQGIFKTSVFGGFDKQSVLTYVDEMIDKAQDKEKELKSFSDEMLSERDSARAKAEELEKKVASLEELVKKYEEATAKAAEQFKEKTGRIAQLEGELSKAEAAAVKLREIAQTSSEKAKKYDEVAAQVGLVMVEAQKQADVVIGRAHQKAEEIAQHAADNVYEINRRIDDFKSDLTRLRTFAGETLRVVDEKMAQMDLSIQQAEQNLYSEAGITEQPGAARGYADEEEEELSLEPVLVERYSEGNPDFFGEPYQG